MARLDRVEKQVTRKPVWDRLSGALCEDGSPFIRTVVEAAMPGDFRVPRLEIYDGRTDPQAHLTKYRRSMIMHGADDATMCKCFEVTLTGPATAWYNSLPPGTITEFQELSTAFTQQFIGSRPTAKMPVQMFDIEQRNGETIRDYVERFNREALSVPDFRPEIRILAMTRGLRRDSQLFYEFSKDPPETLGEFYRRAEQHMTAEELRMAGPKSDHHRAEGSSQQARHLSEHTGRPRRMRGKKPQSFTPLSTTRTNILMALERQGTQIRRPKAMAADNKKNAKKFCQFHRDHGHDTEDCFQLKKYIESLIKQGQLRKYLRMPSPKGRKEEEERAENEDYDSDRRRNRSPKRRLPPPVGVIQTITTGLPSSERKRKAREIAVMEYQSPSKKLARKDGSTVVFPHDDPLLIMARIGNWDVKRVLLDDGSNADVLFSHLLPSLGISSSELKPVTTPTFGVGPSELPVLGWIDLPLMMKGTSVDGAAELYASTMARFIVMDVPSSYNAILGRQTQGNLHIRPDVKYLTVTFATKDGDAEVFIDQAEVRKVFVKTRKAPANSSTQTVEAKAQEKGKEGDPAEAETEAVDLVPGQSTRIGKSLAKGDKENLVSFLLKNKDLFAYSPKDMPGVNPGIIQHSLKVSPEAKPIRQKKRSISAHKSNFVKTEVQRLLDAEVIREVKYPEWLSNVVIATKEGSSKLRMCIDFRNLNDACPKDSFPLPPIDQLVDSTAEYGLPSFLDAFSGYHQIRMDPEDEEKTAFITEGGTYCYIRMPFGLKNAGATYQRLMNKVFKDQMGRNMEVYVDDMIVKSKLPGYHVADLEETFQKLRAFGIRLNPEKCIFGVTSGKFLGYMVSERGIDANPEKIKALLEFRTPATVKDVQRLTGRITSLSRFISRYGDRCRPFFKVLTKAAKMEGDLGRNNHPWDEDCQKAWEELKVYLASLPTLRQPREGEPLVLYLAVTEKAVSSVLIKEEGPKQWPVYYVSKSLHGAEVRYPLLQKAIYALVLAGRRLRPYFQAHPIIVRSSLPLRDVMKRVDHSGRLSKWCIELGEHEITYEPRKAIKAQALADFIAEIPTTEENHSDPKEGEPEWTLHVDGASGSEHQGAGIVIRGPEGLEVMKAIKFSFNVTNNVAEYEALIAGLRLARKIGVRNLRAHSDSQLVVRQTAGDYGAKDPILAKYHELVTKLIQEFDAVRIENVPRRNNTEADCLAKSKTYTEVLDHPSISVLSVTTSGTGWKDPIKRYLAENELPEDAGNAARLRRRAGRFFLIGEELYRQGYANPLQRCVGEEDTEMVLEEVHEGMCGSHIGTDALAAVILRQGYFWPTLRKDARQFVQKCGSCQRHAKIQRIPSEMVTSADYPWPFAVWGIDLIGPLPTAPGGVKFCVVAVDYFSKWVEAEPLATISAKEVQKFVWKNIVCRFGIPRVLVADNGSQFIDKGFQEFISDLGIKMHFAPVAHPQSNGQVEVSNRTIKDGLKKRLGEAKGKWPGELQSVLWSYRTTPRRATGETPFSLVFGTEAIIPIEIVQPSIRVQVFDEGGNDLGLRTKLDLVAEHREIAELRRKAFQQRVAAAINLKARPKEIKKGDLVLRKADFAPRRPSHGVLRANWEGPYLVLAEVRKGVYKLGDAEGVELKNTWHSDALKKFYA
ncbi:reverse transcriptase domain-containing protein [Agrobacterium sp. ST15.13.040]|uniref:reverse transcriptase domain-containing protein n=1 Tax=Agrobacterium sp. ST15.13.040 TaxID=3017318 RepID=UPI0022EC61D6